MTYLGITLGASFKAQCLSNPYLRENGMQIVWLEEVIFVKGREDSVVEEYAFKFTNILSLFIYYSHVCGKKARESIFLWGVLLSWKSISNSPWWHGILFVQRLLKVAWRLRSQGAIINPCWGKGYGTLGIKKHTYGDR